jgi:hypothetical protein
VEDLGLSSWDKRPIKLFRLADWAWVYPGSPPFILFVAANASADKKTEIQRFAVEAIEAGCAYVCTWGDGCSRVHDLFDLASIDADQFVMSTWHEDESLAEALWFALCNAWPDEDEFPNATEAAVILAVEDPWLGEVRSLIADQEELAGLVVGDD